MLFQLDPLPFKITVGKREITDIKTTYSEGAPGEVFGILGSMGYLEIATNRGAAAQLVGTGKGSEVNVVLQGAVAAGNGK
jgi:S-adenosylmethionine hydrolase